MVAVEPPSRSLREWLAGIGARAETLFGDEIVALEEQPDDVRVDLKHAGLRRFEYVIGADSLPTVRKLAFGPRPQFETDLGHRSCGRGGACPTPSRRRRC
jgi:2-polyprenyl-6-methoxyphenol hydroxylase-like FAD-dependent oxidoreductase